MLIGPNSPLIARKGKTKLTRSHYYCMKSESWTEGKAREGKGRQGTAVSIGRDSTTSAPFIISSMSVCLYGCLGAS